MFCLFNNLISLNNTYTYKIRLMDHTYFNKLNTYFYINYSKEAYRNINL